MAEFFFSYTSSDRQWAEWIGQYLKGALGHTPRLHDWEVPAGGDIGAWMEIRHEAADHVLCVVSEAYLKAAYSSWERRAAAWAAQTDKPNFLLPILIEDCEVPTLMRSTKRCHLFGLNEEEAARERLKAYLSEPTAPTSPIAFPGARSAAPPRPNGAVSFPGSASPAPAPAPLPWPNAIMARDRFGPHASFQVPGTDVVQRLRWCPPGRFLMGSPESEVGRNGREGPLHEVVFAAGFWLFDTPCTQALWEAVTGKNPSNFKDHPALPVETVSFTDTVDFISQLNALVPGLSLRLPSEAQWEYACRAGTITPRYDAVDDIAWHDGNSNLRTQPVGRKEPNSWGLHDTLGNVWEWCEDHWHDSYKNAPRNGCVWLSRVGGMDRVTRGGSWINVPRVLRAAYRGSSHPGVRNSNQGFRCARV